MPFVKLDTRILDSTLWLNADVSRLFLTALLMAEPRPLETPMPQLEVRSLDRTGFVVPAGWYGFIAAAGPGIIRRAMLKEKEGFAALEALGSADPESRSSDFEGRRLVRVEGGFVVLNFMKFRDKDHGAADRMKRLRDRKKAESVMANEADVLPNVTAVPPNVTHSREQSSESRGNKENTLVPAALSAQAADEQHSPENWVRYWNKHRGPLSAVREQLSSGRLRKLKLRIAHGLTPERFMAVVAKIQRTPFCLGEKDWKVTFDWLIANDDNVDKILDGNYDRAQPPRPVYGATIAKIGE